jgi:hypothetical protein
MKRSLLLLVVLLFLAVLLSCSTTLPESQIECLELPDEPAPEGSVGPLFSIRDHGSLTTDPSLVISGSASLVGTNTDPEAKYNQILWTGPEALRFDAKGTYTVRFTYRIVEMPADTDMAFEVLMYSQTGEQQDEWIDSLALSGQIGTAGTTEFTYHLLDYPDYDLLWTIVSTGSIVIDDIEVFDKEGNLVVSESFEVSRLQSAQIFLPPAKTGRPYYYMPAIFGEAVQPVTVRCEGKLPDGLSVDGEGCIRGVPTQEGDHTILLSYTDALGAVSRLLFYLTVTSAYQRPDEEIIGMSSEVPNHVTYTYRPYTQAFRNPLKGMRPSVQSTRNHPWATLGRPMITWNLIERNACDTVEQIKKVTDELIGDLSAYNIKIIPRVYLAWPPDRTYWPEDLESGDYYSKAFKERMFELIRKLGEAWDDDPRIAYIEMGIIGDWGEHHDPGFGNLGFEEPHPVLYERQFAEAFENAFKNKLLMHRYPRDFIGYPFGLHWDTFGTIGTDPYWANDSQMMSLELHKSEHADAWKTLVRGGEIDPTFLGYPNWDMEYFNSLVKEHSDRLVQLIRNLHWNHLAVLEYVDENDQELWEKGSAIQHALGYTFVINKGTLSEQIWRSEFYVNLSISNTGASPFYYRWPVQVSLIDSKTFQLAWNDTWEEIDIRTWLPGETVEIEKTFMIPSLPEGEYLAVVSILDPSGNIPSVRFANENYLYGGYTVLGKVGIGQKPENLYLSGFDELTLDRSQYYLPPLD